MRLKKWLHQQVPRRGAVERLARKAGISRESVYAGIRGTLRNVATCKAITAATRNEVSVDDLTHATPAHSTHTKFATE